MKTLAIIPARGGSKGIRGKNLTLVAGKPLLAYTIEAALESKFVSRIVVSTDSPEIGVVARQCGAEVVERPAELSGDAASSESALLDTLKQLRETENYRPDLIVCLQCTSPLTLAEDIDGTIQQLLDDKADSALAVVPFHYFLWRRNEPGEAEGINHDKSVRPLRQSRDPQYLETGASYVMRTDGFEQSRHRFFGKTSLYVMPLDRCLEIDEPRDLLVGEVLIQERTRQDRIRLLPSRVLGVVFDFDGVFTDNHVFCAQDGTESVRCDRSDGLGISRLKAAGVPILVLSVERNAVVRARCNKLGIECRHGVSEKLPALLAWISEQRLNAAEVVYVGNDLNDVECLKAVGCGVAVNDAYPEAKAAATFTLSASGGEGAVREIVDLILDSNREKTNAQND